jgi:hypothetical protein
MSSFDSLEDQLDYLNDQVKFLKARIDEISARLVAIDSGKAQAAPVLQDEQFAKVAPPKEDVLFWAGQALLPRIAAVCFMLVAALVLRTLTDGDFIGKFSGSILGIVYASALIAWGWYQYTKQGRLAPVFPGCGLLLFFSVILETHTRFESVSTLWAYVLLVSASLPVVIIGLRYNASFLLSMAVIGASLSGMAINFPNPHFPLLGGLLLAANIAAYFAFEKKISPALRWVVLIFTVLFWMLWAFKLNVPLTRGVTPVDRLYLTWFVPTLFVFWLFNLLIVWKNVFKGIVPGFFESLLPTINSAGAFAALNVVVIPWTGKGWLPGVAALIVAAVHFFFAAGVSKHNKEGALGSNVFTFAGVVLLLVGMPLVSGRVLWSLPVWSVCAYILILFSDRWRNGGVRVSSYFLQAGSAVAAIFYVYPGTKENFAGTAFIALILSVVSLLQYHWCRKHLPVTKDSAYFSWLDKNDFSGVVLLLAGLLNGLYFFRFGLTGFLPGELWLGARMSGLTFIINMGSVVLMIAGLKKRSLELMVVAVCIALFGAAKVFLWDLFKVKGVFLVVSVFSFGVVAAVGSVVMGKWQRAVGSEQ